ncbi:MAG: D-alanyl-D-alanine carboxypeptidase, partial [Actinomycetota bacterium]|nr:D-alanyl-D-alanine carboxypeptidase [Actinomycetota bacterium]
ARPVAARNLRESVAPVLATAPPDTCVEVRDGGNVVVSHNAATPLIPASNMKLLVANAALELLGPDTRLSTRFVTDGAPTDGAVVRGNLYMVGGGDPLLTTGTYNSRLPNGKQPVTDMDDVADQIAATGIKEITGSIVGDGSRYDAVRTTPSWPDRFFAQGQVAPLSALLVDDGWRSSGGPAEDPDVHAAAVLTELLEDRGIAVGGAATSGVAPSGAPLLTEVPSLTIAELVAELLRFSDNTTAELLVKEMGAQQGAGGSTAAGLDVMRAWVESSGVPAEGVTFDDASGLSDADRVTCSFLATLLASGGPDGVVANGLAVPGQAGTLDDRLTGADLRDRVRAKTGTLRTSTALSGWLTTRPSVPLAFSIITNTTDRQVTAADTELQGRLLTAMLDYPASPDIAALSPTPPTGV